MQFGALSGIAFDGQDQIYVADSESDNVNNPGWEQGIRIGDAKTGWVKEAAQALGVSPSTTRRDWRTAKAWLNRELRLEVRS